MGWNPIDTAPREHDKTVLLSDGIGLPAYEGYWEAFADFDLLDDAYYSIAGMDLETRRELRGFWYTPAGYERDGERGARGDSKVNPQFWMPMPEPPAEPVTLATLPGELGKLGFTDEWDYWVNGAIRVFFRADGIHITKGSLSYGRRNPAKALALVKLLMEGAE